MKIFTSLSSLAQLNGDPLIHVVRRELLPIVSSPSYRRENDGFLVLIEPSDTSGDLHELGLSYRLHEVPFEGVTLEEGIFHAIYVPNNQFALSFLVPDADWLPAEVREHLERDLHL
jgi:hypothetical protein